MIRLRVLYGGRVQGVGFRATVEQIARGYEVAGWVKNLPDGRVELVAEGERETVRRLLSAVANRLGNHIDATAETEQTPGDLADFRIER